MIHLHEIYILIACILAGKFIDILANNLRYITQPPSFFKEGMLDEANAEYSRGDYNPPYEYPHVNKLYNSDTFILIPFITFAPTIMVQVQIINKSPHLLPEYQTDGASGMDIRAWLPQPVTLKPMERRLIPTGLYIALPSGHEAQVRPRSGLAIKRGLTLINTPGTIDSDYRGEIMIPLVNLSVEDQLINDGERIAQMIVSKYEKVAWENVESLENTTRGAGGFGHSGHT